jgi:hypothetical protein
MSRVHGSLVSLVFMVSGIPAYAGVSLQYISERRMPEATVQKIKKDAERVNRRRAWAALTQGLGTRRRELIMAEPIRA